MYCTRGLAHTCLNSPYRSIIRVLRNGNAPTLLHEKRNRYLDLALDTNWTPAILFYLRTTTLSIAARIRPQFKPTPPRHCSAFNTAARMQKGGKESRDKKKLVSRRWNRARTYRDERTRGKSQIATLMVRGRPDDWRNCRQRATRQPSAGLTHAPFAPRAQPCFPRDYPLRCERTFLLSTFLFLLIFFLLFDAFNVKAFFAQRVMQWMFSLM